MKKNDWKGRLRILLVLLVIGAVIAAVVIAFSQIRNYKESDNEIEAQTESSAIIPAEKKNAGIKLTPLPEKTPSPEPSVTASPEPLSEVLESLEDIEAGTILTEEEIDPEEPDRYFTAYEISDEIFERIYGDDRSYKTYCTVPREDLRYIKMLHIGFDGKIHVGEMIVNRLIAEDITEIFKELYINGYQIEKMFLVDNYQADDLLSIDDNNTSAFNYRTITDGDCISNHGYGIAVDINPIQNPYVYEDGYGNYTGEDRDWYLYTDRNAPDAAQRHMINHDDLCYKLFTEHGFEWGGDWSGIVDFQHFEKLILS